MENILEIKSFEELKGYLKKIESPKITLILVDQKNYKKLLVNLLKVLVNEENAPGIFITFNYPYSFLRNLFDEENINTKNLYFIDCISQTMFVEKVSVSYSEVLTTEECIFLRSPTHLSELAIIVYELLSSIKNPQKKFVILDSLHAMSIYNSKDRVVKFTHFLLNKLRIFRMTGFISLSLKNEVLEEVSDFFDEILKIENL